MSSLETNKRVGSNIFQATDGESELVIGALRAVLSSEAIFTARRIVKLIQSSPFVASYTQQGGGRDLFYTGAPWVRQQMVVSVAISFSFSH